MAVVPVLPPVTTGVYTTSAVSAIVAATSFSLNKPVAQLRQTVAQPLATGTWTSILFDTEDLDSDPSGGTGGHSTSVNTSRFTAVYPGWYLITGGIGYTPSAANSRLARIAVNGSLVLGSRSGMAAHATYAVSLLVRPTQVYLNVNDYAEIQGLQDTGAPLNTYVLDESMSTMVVQFVRNA